MPTSYGLFHANSWKKKWIKLITACMEIYLTCNVANMSRILCLWETVSSFIKYSIWQIRLTLDIHLHNRLNRNLVWGFYVKTVMEFSQKNRQNVTREDHQGPFRGHGQVPVRVSGAVLVDCGLYDEWLENEVYHNLWKVVTWHCLTWLPCCRPNGTILKLVGTSKYLQSSRMS